MANSRLFAILSFLSLALSVFAAPSELDTRSTPAPVFFAVNLTWENYAPVGGPGRKAILTNGTIPGPPLRCNVGDTINFLVHNNLPNETTIHFHGIQQTGTPWSDGVAGVSQKPIQPGKAFMYTWVADESGTYFYHAHLKGQIMDGLYGAIIIQPKDAAKRPWSFISNDTSVQQALTAAEKSLTPVFLSDWSKYNSHDFYQFEKIGNVDNACADAVLINGQGSVYCLTRDEITAYTNPAIPALLAGVNPPVLTDKGCLPPNTPAIQGNFSQTTDKMPADLYYTCNPSTGTMAEIDVDASKKWVALSFINTGGFLALKFTIDGHKMWVYGTDGQYIVPQLVDEVVISNGERYMVMVQLNQKAASYAIRVANAGLNQVVSGFAIMKYKGSNGAPTDDPNSLSVMNYAGVSLTKVVPFIPPFGAPFPPVAPAATADATFSFTIKKLGRPYGAYEWTLTGVDGYNMSLEDDKPLLFQQPSQVPQSDLVIQTKKGQWVDLIIKVLGPLAEPHPMHKHSNKAFILGQGVGDFTYTNVADAAAAMPPHSFNFATPPLRDGFTTVPAEGNSTWMALRYQVVNPGAFLLHCHMQTHFSGGMAVAMLDGVDAWPTVPKAYANGNGYTATLGKEGKVPPKS